MCVRACGATMSRRALYRASSMGFVGGLVFTQQWDGHPPEHPRRSRHEDAHVAQGKPSAEG
jgi:hypothetical protein